MVHNEKQTIVMWTLNTKESKMEITIKRIENRKDKMALSPIEMVKKGAFYCYGTGIYRDYWAAFVEEQFIGFIIGDIEETEYGNSKTNIGRLLACYVVEEFRRKGVGKKLFETLEKYFIDNNCCYMYASYEDYSADIKPESLFFQKLGFVKLFLNESGLPCWRDGGCPTNFIVVKYIGQSFA
jgi:GNAT superfamily N-acetyltransferase